MINRFTSRYAAAIWAREQRIEVYYIRHGRRFYTVYVPIIDNPLTDIYETLTREPQNPARFKSRYYALRWAKAYDVRDFIVKSYKTENGVRYAIFIPANTDTAIRVYGQLIKEIKHD